MQLQRHIETLKQSQIDVFAVSYDTVPELRAFADKYDIGYQLLSDADSATIRRFGILNTLIERDNPIKTRAGRSYYGIPFSGVYVIDGAGVVREKFFNRSYATRNSAGTLLNSALGDVLKPEAGPESNWQDERISFTAFLADPELKLEYESTLYVRFQLADGYHIYAEPLPDGFHATTVEIDQTPGLTLGEPTYPGTRLKAFKLLDVTLPIYEGEVTVAIPIRANAKLLNWMRRDKPESIDVTTRVKHQVCSDTVCYPPGLETLVMTVPLGPMQSS